MSETKRSAALGVIGLAALAAYALACRASFSPDGKRLLFPSYDEEAKTYCVALYDLEKGTARPFFTATGAGDDGPLYAMRWTPDGKSAVIAWSREKDECVRVVRMPLEPGIPARFYTVPSGKEQGDAAAMLMAPPAHSKGRLIFTGGTRLDLATGEVSEKQMPETMFVEHGGEVFFLREDRADGGKRVFAMGKISEEEKVLLELKEEEHGELTGHMAVSPDGSRFAAGVRRSGDAGLLVIRGGAVEKTIVLGPRAEIEPGNLAWSAATGAVHAAFAKKVEGKGVELGVLEVSLDGSPPRKTVLVSSSDADAEEQLLLFQIALSPDGKTLAVASTYVEDAREEDRALFLMDLSSAERKVKKVPIAAPRKGD
jgi:hypothetical protein